MDKYSKQEISGCILNMLKYSDHETMKYRLRGESNSKVAAFDLDHTLIKPKKTKLPRGRDDWMWLPGVKEKLSELYDADWRIVIFTNQSGKYVEDVLGKITDIQLDVTFPFSVYCATKSDYYYKPMTGMWEIFLLHNKVPLKKVFFCGDAAGRVKDFACSDRAFAENVGITFHTPEEFFNKKPVDKEWECIGYPLNFKKISTSKEPEFSTKSQEIVVITGYPGCGKSRLAKKYKNYKIVSKDEYKTRSMKVLTETLKTGKSVVIDDTNTNEKLRQPYIDLAHKLGIKIRSVYINADINVCMHMNNMRHQISKGKIQLIPKVAYYVKRKTFSVPKKSEGFDEISEVGFILDKNLPREYLMKYNLLK